MFILDNDSECDAPRFDKTDLENKEKGKEVTRVKIPKDRIMLFFITSTCCVFLTQHANYAVLPKSQGFVRTMQSHVFVYVSTTQKCIQLFQCHDIFSQNCLLIHIKRIGIIPSSSQDEYFIKSTFLRMVS
ncbi:hypothetical protein TNCT_467621 [Trichonephila clavata]|uniref:Uncharacterized protein n=1 Tax=Trichonephila clavata TaxID=2740835 RepID=A0A8X6G713_TRICU|nr:hypothetical protein TNCT_467621 [Trichonephila clavata]